MKGCSFCDVILFSFCCYISPIYSVNPDMLFKSVINVTIYPMGSTDVQFMGQIQVDR